MWRKRKQDEWSNGEGHGLSLAVMRKGFVGCWKSWGDRWGEAAWRRSEGELSGSKEVWQRGCGPGEVEVTWQRLVRV